MEKSHVAALVKAADECGGVSKLAAALQIGQNVVSNWKARGTFIDPLHCVAIERRTDGRVKRQDLRPNDWHLIWPELVQAVTPRPELAEQQA